MKRLLSERDPQSERASGWQARTAGTDSVLFIAEVSSNHQRDLGRCLEFVDRAAAIGCDGVKFQLFRIAELFAPEVLAASAEHRSREQWELPVSFLAPLAERARARGLLFGCTPFDLAAVAELEPHVDFYKIASYELLWDRLLAACARSRKPLVISTGMADHREVRHAVDLVAREGCRDLTMLHCVSAYPTPVAESNLAAIGSLRRLRARVPRVRLNVGWSDHSVEPGVIARAVHRHGARMIEFHLDLEGAGAEFGAGHCWLPDAMGRLIHDIRVGFGADGDGQKRPTAAEQDERAWRADPSDGKRPLLATRGSYPS